MSISARSFRPCIHVCETCRFNRQDKLNDDGLSGGELLYQQLCEVAKKSPYSEQFEVKRARCMMGCSHHCNIHIRAPQKINYVIGHFQPNAESAATIINYFEKYLQSDEGQVPFGTWPPGIKGNFIARIPAF